MHVTLCCLLMSGAHNLLHAQSHFQAEWNFAVGFQREEFANRVDKPGIGWGIEFGYLIPHSPFSVGTSFVRMVYGKQEAHIFQYSDGADKPLCDAETKNSILQWHLFFRLRGKLGVFRPYLEALGGINYLQTQARFFEPQINYEISSRVYQDDYSFSYGGGAGLMISLVPIFGKVMGASNFYIDLRVRYLAGKPAKYLQEELLIAKESDLDEKYSETDLITAQVGLIVEF
jgi:hypothetical protein